MSTTKNSSENITRLHERQLELASKRENPDEKITIDVRYPRKYEEATEIVDLLLSNESILIDFQYMTEVQARRCLDYLDGARYVLAGNLRRVASTMYLLTPINVWYCFSLFQISFKFTLSFLSFMPCFLGSLEPQKVLLDKWFIA